jgi:hypothetical protein
MQELRQKIQVCETDKGDMIVKLAGAQAKITILEAWKQGWADLKTAHQDIDLVVLSRLSFTIVKVSDNTVWIKPLRQTFLVYVTPDAIERPNTCAITPASRLCGASYCPASRRPPVTYSAISGTPPSTANSTTGSRGRFRRCSL